MSESGAMTVGAGCRSPDYFADGLNTMASEYWIGPNGNYANPGSGNFSVASYWSGGYVPNSSTDIYLYSSGYTVYVDQVESVNSIYDNAGSLYIANSLTIASSSTFYNYGTTTIYEAPLVAPNGLKLDGGGSIILLEPSSTITQGSTSASGTIENVNNLIEGAGTFGSGTFTNDAGGIVFAYLGGTDGFAPSISFKTGNVVHNAGRMIAANDTQGRGGRLVFYDKVVNTGTVEGYGIATVEIGGYRSTAYVNTFLKGGSVYAEESSVLQIDPNAALIGATTEVASTATMTIGGALRGGSLTSTGFGNVTITGQAYASNPRLDGSSNGALTLDADIDVTDGTTLEALGTISNGGSITFEDQADLLIPTSSSLTLADGGYLYFAGGGNHVIDAAANGGTFHNGNRIFASGYLGQGHLVLDNTGDVFAGVSGGTSAQTLKVELYGTSSTNAGYLGAFAGSTLEFVSGGLFNSGTIYASGNVGSTVKIDAGFQLGNLAGGTLTGGTWQALSNGTVLFGDGSVSKLAATIDLEGSGSTLRSGTGSSLQTIEQTLTQILSGGTLEVGEARGYTTGNALSLAGTLDLENGGTFRSGLISGTTASVITGYGATVASAVTTAGTVSATSGTLTFTGASDTFSGKFTGGGTVAFASGTDTLNKGVALSTANTLVSGATVKLGANVTDSGTFAMTGGALSLASFTFTASGTGTLTGGTVTGPGTLALTGATDTVAGVTLAGGATLSHTGTGTLTASGALALAGASGTTDTVTNGSGATLQLYTGAITTGSGVTGAIGNAGTLQKVGGSGKFTLGGTLTNTGTVLARTGTLEIANAVAGTGTLGIKGGTLQLDALPASGQTLAFQSAGTLALGRTGTYANTITGFSGGDTIDLLSFKGGTVKSFVEAGDRKSGTLTLSSSAGQTTRLTLAGSYTAANFATAADAGGTGTAVTFKAAAKAMAAAASSPATGQDHLLAAMGSTDTPVAADHHAFAAARILFEGSPLPAAFTDWTQHGEQGAADLYDFALAARPSLHLG